MHYFDQAHFTLPPDPTQFMYVHKYLDILSTTYMMKTLRSLNIPQHIYFVQPSLYTNTHQCKWFRIEIMHFHFIHMLIQFNLFAENHNLLTTFVFNSLFFPSIYIPRRFYEANASQLLINILFFSDLTYKRCSNCHRSARIYINHS